MGFDYHYYVGNNEFLIYFHFSAVERKKTFIFQLFFILDLVLYYIIEYTV